MFVHNKTLDTFYSSYVIEALPVFIVWSYRGPKYLEIPSSLLHEY